MAERYWLSSDLIGRWAWVTFNYPLIEQLADVSRPSLGTLIVPFSVIFVCPGLGLQCSTLRVRKILPAKGLNILLRRLKNLTIVPVYASVCDRSMIIEDYTGESAVCARFQACLSSWQPHMSDMSRGTLFHHLLHIPPQSPLPPFARSNFQRASTGATV